PIYVNFTLPQQELGKLRTGLPVKVTSDALPGLSIDGRITAVNPLVDVETRNVQLQATVANKAEKLRPGMFVNVA
ncbi:MAG: efflux transporter periplasmic adaptor subunit, partial [Deltaproteobacteria bacterium]